MISISILFMEKNDSLRKKKGGYKHPIELPIKQYPLGRSEHLSLVTCVSSEVH
jgi:hypothetical protein